MRVASLDTGGRDGTLALVSSDGTRTLVRPNGISTFQEALDDWHEVAAALDDAWAELDRDPAAGEPLDAGALLAPLPRAYEWCEGSTYLAHMERIRAARGMQLPPEHRLEPIVYQAGASRLLSPLEDIPLPDPAWGLDLEATLAVITDDVPIGTTAEDAPAHVLFLVLLNDLSYRNLLPLEYAKSIGPYLSKPTRPFAPFAVSAASLGSGWDGRTLRSTVRSWVNGELLGAIDSSKDNVFDFAVMIEYLTRTRSLAAGTIVGTGAVANWEPANGFACLGEKRAGELAATGAPSTPWLAAGDTLRIEAFDEAGSSIFGAMDQRIV
jgi:fumarylacetoacetate (FAA) hydrolase